MSQRIICQGCAGPIDIPEGFTRKKIRCGQCGVYCEVPSSARKRPVASGVTPGPARKEAPAAPSREHVDEDLFREVMEKEEPRPAPRPARRPTQQPSKRPDARPPARPPAWKDDEDDDRPYEVVGGPEKICPNCKKVMPAEAVLCTACGFNQDSGDKAVRVFQPIDRSWDTGMPRQQRFKIFLGLVAITFLPVILHSYTLVVPFLIYSALLAFLLGTYDKIHLTRNKKGRCVLTKTFHVCFVAQPEADLHIYRHEGVTVGLADDTGLSDWIMLLILVPTVVPAILWWWFVIRRTSYFVALTKDHGFPELMLYRGWNQDLTRDMAEVISDAAGLPYQRG